MTIRIFVGTAANNEDLESQAVLEYTLRKYTSEELEITWMQQTRDPASMYYGWNTTGWATPFSGFRWSIPAACAFEGRAIYLDSDMIVQADIAELYNKTLNPGYAVMAKGISERFCCTLFDNAVVEQHMFPLARLKKEAGMHRLQRQRLAKPGIVQSFPRDENWNCLDGENYADLKDPRIKIHHYTAIDCQVQLKYALPRLAKAGLPHWFKGTYRPHPRPDLQALFDQALEEAIEADYHPENYEVEPFGNYASGGSEGGAWVKGPAKMGV